MTEILVGIFLVYLLAMTSAAMIVRHIPAFRWCSRYLVGAAIASIPGFVIFVTAYMVLDNMLRLLGHNFVLPYGLRELYGLWDDLFRMIGLPWAAIVGVFTGILVGIYMVYKESKRPYPS